MDSTVPARSSRFALPLLFAGGALALVRFGLLAQGPYAKNSPANAGERVSS
jgi:hypothetical protein